MNAYDIAKDLDREGKFPGHICYGTSPLLVRAANMLRQQADRIAELEKQLKPLTQSEMYEVFEKCIDGEGFDKYRYAAEILKKASEK